MLAETETEDEDTAGKQAIIKAATSRWLNVSELGALLDREKTPLHVSADKPYSPPQSGELFLYDRAVTHDYKDDGHEWVKRRNSSKIREDYVKLRVEGRFRFAGCYAYSATTPTFHRRAYHLLDNSSTSAVSEEISPNSSQRGIQIKREESTDSETGQGLVLVHYLDKSEKTSSAKLPLSGIISEAPKLELPKTAPKKLSSSGQNTSRSQALKGKGNDKPSTTFTEGPQPLRNKEQLNMLQAQLYRQEIESAVVALSDNRISSKGDLSRFKRDDERGGRATKEAVSRRSAENATFSSRPELSPTLPSFKRGKRNATEAEIDTVRNEPLPDIVDFSPDNATISTNIAAKSTTMVISCSAPLPTLSNEDDGFTWHTMAAFVDSNLTGLGGSPDLEIRAVNLSIVNRLNLHTYRCTVPNHVESLGERRIVIVGVRLYSGTNPVCDGVSAGVAITLQTAWREAFFHNSSRKSSSSLLTFYSRRKPSGPGATANLRILSQLSSDLFTFQDTAQVVTHTQHLPPKTNEETISSAMGDSELSAPELPAPLTTMAMIATVLPDFPNPPAHAVIEPSALVATKIDLDSSADGKHTTHVSVLRDLLGTSAANAAVANALEATVDPTVDGAMIKQSETKLDSYTSSNQSKTPSDSDTMSMRNAALCWASTPTSMSKDETIGGEVDRHCKICFIKKLTAVIAAIEEVISPSIEENMWSRSGFFEDSGYCHDLMPESNPFSTDSQNIEQTVEDLPREETKKDIDEKIEYTDKDGGIPILDDVELTVMHEDRLDGLLDSLLIRVVESLVEMGTASYEIQEEINLPQKSGFTLLHFASLYNLQSFVPVLLSRGANPDTPTMRGKLTPLHLACGAGNWAIVEILVRKGCAVQICDSFGSLPADHALRSGYPKIARWLEDTSGEDATQRIDHREAEIKRQTEFMKLNR